VAAQPRGRHVRLADGRHFPRSPRLAAELVAAAGVRPGEVVLEPGAGFGRLTAPLLAAGARVWAVELDPDLAERLRRRFAGTAIEVVTGDALRTALPDQPYRVVGNLPFAVTTALLRRLLAAPAGPLQRIDGIVEHGLAVKRTRARPSTLLSATWGPWWRLELERVLPAAAFDPPPAVDAAVLVVRPRTTPLLDPAAAAAHAALVAAGYAVANRPLRDAGLVPPLIWKRFARDRGLRLDARPRDLDVWDWIAFARARAGHRTIR
jgi:23S rRNA (adenine-N6)-dimethyltransferase